MLNQSKEYTVYPIELLQIIKENPITYTFVFSKPKDLTWQEGAHAHIALNAYNESIGWFEKKDVRHLSIVSLENEGNICITTRIRHLRSEFKEVLFKAVVGDIFYVFKVGSRLVLRRDEKPILILSSGVAIASARPLIKTFYSDSKGITSLKHINVDSYQYKIFSNEMEHYLEKSNFSNLYVSSRADFYSALSDVFKEHKSCSFFASQDKEQRNFNQSNFKEAYIYILGSDAFIDEIKVFLNQAGINNNQIILDKKM